ncbi:MAG: ATP synthase F1 subunit delta [Actinomycetota bacterium]|nr:ATP synthase F1 subunit delta [Actinomycetota bacterium]
MSEDRITAYARAMFDVASAEGNLASIGDELFRFARALEGSDELRNALTDPHLPASRRQQIVEDLLGGKAQPATVALVGMAVGLGRARELPAIIDSLVGMAAAESGKAVAEVRSAIELTEDQRNRLAEALGRTTGQQVDIKVVIDPSVLGGLVTTVGDTVIDGSVRSRLEQLKHAF